MAIIKCKMCGGDLSLIDGQSVAQCEYCGSRQTVPASDNEKKLNLFASANKLRSACEFDRAAGVYDSIKAEFPDEAEAYWGLVLCKYGIEYVDDPATGKKVPTCHRSSYDSVLDDENFALACDYADSVARKVYREDGRHLEEIRKGILEVSSKQEPYDIFICYKETDTDGNRTLDSVLAQDLYTALTDKGYRVFFSRVTLKGQLGQAYEPYIFAALHSAKVMLAVGTDYDYFNAVWVKNEWSRYLKIIAQSKDKFLIPCFKGIDAYDMPKEFRPLQAVDLGQMGAVQDIVFNMEKYIPLKKNTIVIQERVVVGGAGGSNKIASLLDRGNMALEDGDWAKADSFFEDVLNNDSKNAQAYIGKTLAQERCRTMDALVRKRRDVYQNVRSEKRYIQEKTAHIGEMAEQFCLPGYVEQNTIRDLYRFDLSYASEASGRENQYRQEENWWQEHKQLSRAEKFAAGAVAETLQREKNHLFSQLSDRVKQAEKAEAAAIETVKQAYTAHIIQADETVEKMHQDALQRREKDYQYWQDIAKNDPKVNQLEQAKAFFTQQADYRDSDALAEHCRKRIDDIIAELKRKEAEAKAAAEAEAERQRILAAKQAVQRKARNKKIAILSAIAAVVVIAIVVVLTKVVIPNYNYDQAMAMMEEGKTAEAAIAFAQMDTYKYSREYSLLLWEMVAQRDTVDVGYDHTVGLKSDGTVLVVGDNRYGQCDVSEWRDIVAISAEAYHTVGLKADGTVVAVGDNLYDQCEVSGWRNIVAITVNDAHTVGLKSDGTVVAVGNNMDGQCEVSGWRNIVAISAGDDHTVGLKADGTVVAVGNNYSGQCNVSEWRDIVAISAGDFHTMGLKADGTVVAVGYNEYGQCEVSGWKDIVSISAGWGLSVGLKSDGTMVVAGYDEYDASDWTGIVAIKVGWNHDVGLKADGTVIATGFNGDGECNVSDWTNIQLPE